MTAPTDLDQDQGDIDEAPDGSSRFVMQGTGASGFLPDLLPKAIVDLAEGIVGSPDQAKAELDSMADAVREFWAKEPDVIMRDCAAYSARCTELAIHLHRLEATSRSYKQIRTLEVDPLLKELDRQFKIASRLVEVRRQDMELMR